MGLIRKIKELFSAQKYIMNVLAEQDKQCAKYAGMSNAELAALSDDDLLSAVLYRCDRKIAEADNADEPEAPEILNGAERTVHMLSVWDAELQENGLCNYFVICNGMPVTGILPALSKVGAGEHRTLFEQFIAENQIDLSDLSFFILKNRACYAEKYTRYPFEAFDNAYRALPPLEPYLVRFVRANIDQF